MARWQAFLPSYAGIIGYAPPPVSVPGVNSRPYRMTTPKRRLPPHAPRRELGYRLGLILGHAATLRAPRGRSARRVAPVLASWN
jgi:hypothetical protein